MEIVTLESPRYILDALGSVVSVKPVVRIGRNQVRGLKPATGFMLSKKLLACARHTSIQSPLALVTDVDANGLKNSKHQAQNVDWQRFRKIHALIPDNHRITGESLSPRKFDYDIDFYRLEVPRDGQKLHCRPDHFRSIGDAVFVLGVVFAENRYELMYSEGKVTRVLESNGGPILLLIDADTCVGFSGGPVIHRDTGEAIAVLAGGWETESTVESIAWTITAADKPSS